MIILEFIWKIIHAVLKIISVFIQIILTIVEMCISFVGGIIAGFCFILGALFVAGSFPCLIIGWIDKSEFWQMLIFGCLFGVIPMTIVFAGKGIIEGIVAGLKEL